jgi:hypothetical protein
MRPPLPAVELPFLIVHGRTVWIAVTIFVSALLIAVLARRRAEPITLFIVPFFVLLGQCAIGRAAYSHASSDGYRLTELSSWSAVGIAAASPMARGEMIKDIDHAAREPGRTRKRLAFSAAWLHFNGECFADHFLERWEFDASLEDALACGDVSDVLKVLNFQGRFGALAAVLTTTDGYSARVDVKLGNWRGAANRALTIANGQRTEELQKRWKCFAALLATYGGAMGAFDGLPSDDFCIALESLSGTISKSPTRASLLPQWLLIAVDATRGELTADIDYDSSFFLDSYWTPFFLRGPTHDSRFILVDNRNFKLAMLRGHFSEARTVAAGLGDGSEWTESDRAEMFDEIAVHDGSVVAPMSKRDWWDPDANALRLRERMAVPSPPPPGDYVDEEAEQAFADALLVAQVTGDAAPLVDAVRSVHEVDGWRMSSLMAVAPQLRGNTNELLQAVWDQQFVGFGDWKKVDSLWLAKLADLRDLARLLGQLDDASTLQGYIDRQLAPYDDLRKVTALWLFDHLDEK